MTITPPSSSRVCAQGAREASRLRDVPWLIAVLAVAVGARAAWIAFVNVSPVDGRIDDTVFYYVTAKFVAAGLGYRDPYWGNYTAQWPPGYPLLLTPLFKILGPSYVAAKALNVVLAGGTCLLTYALGRRAFDRRVGIAAAFVLAVFPGQVFFSDLVMTEVFFGFLFLGVLLLLLEWTIDVEGARWWRVLVIGLLVGCLALVRAEAALFPAAIIVLWKLTVPGWRRTLRYAGILLAGFAIALTPWTARNAVRFHEFVPLRANPSGALSNALDPGYDSRANKLLPAPPLRQTVRHAAGHPWELVAAQAHKIAILYGDDMDGIYWVQSNRPTLSQSAADRWSHLASGYFFAVLALALAATPLWLSMKRRGPPVLGFTVIEWTLIVTIFWPETRYHFPIVPVLCIFAAALVVAGWDAVAGRRGMVADDGG